MAISPGRFGGERCHYHQQKVTAMMSRRLRDEIFWRTADVLAENVGQSVLPIFTIDDRGPKQWGTGTLLEVADRSFIVSASHVFDRAREQERILLLADCADGGSLVPLDGVARTAPKSDVAFIELQPTLAKRLKWRFLRFDSVAQQVNHSAGLFFVYGYPARLADPALPDGSCFYEPLRLFTVPFSGDAAMVANYVPAVHFLLECHWYRVWGEHGRARLPRDNKSRIDLGGISGCSLWAISSDPDTDTFEPAKAKIAGIITAFNHPHNLIKGTQWGVVRRLMADAFPDLSGAIRLVYPR
jgi:hypothetical protein